MTGVVAMNFPSIKIGNRLIGKEHKPLVIPEIGINHNGCLEIAKDMVDAAHEAGAEIVKHQTHIPEDEMSIVADSIIPVHASKSIFKIMKDCALCEDDEIELKKYVESKGMIFLSTPFSRKAADRLERMGVSAYKIGSGEMNNIPLIRHIAEFKKPMIVSTGMNSIESVKKTVETLEKCNAKYALLHTTNIYPTPPNLIRLGAMIQLKDTFEGVIFGLSDHTINNNACIAALALGASIVERHFTDHKSRVGPDIICSMDKNDLISLLQSTNEIHMMLGGEKNVINEEQDTANFAFATVVSIKGIKKGEIFTEDNIWVKRPGSGEIPASEYDNILGARAAEDISVDTQIKRRAVENNLY